MTEQGGGGVEHGPSPIGSETMGPADAVLWDIEHDPVLRSTITAVAVFDRVPDWDRLSARLAHAVTEVPRLAQRVVNVPLGLGPPRWVPDPEFDLSFHLRRVRAPGHRDLAAVLELAQPIAATPFDRSRPLWEFTLVEGMADGRAALIQKVHHSLTDGVGGVQLALALLDDRPDTPLDPPPGAVRHPPVGVPGGLEMLGRTAIEQGIGVVRAVASLPAAVRDVAPRTRALVPSTVRLLRPISAPASSVLRGRSVGRRLAVIEIPLEDLRAAARAGGASINDAFLAAVVGGLARYHAHHGAAMDELRINMPVNVRVADDDVGVGNRFTPARFAVPGDIDDPVERMHRLGALARAWRDEPAMAFSDTMAAALELLPVPVTAAVFRALLANVDVVCSNVPGLPGRCWIAGAEMVREYPFAPPAGAALSVTLMSHGETACIGIACDAAAVHDPAILSTCLAEGLSEIVDLGA